MPKGHEEQRGNKKKAKYTLKEKRQLKKEKKQREYDQSHPHIDEII